MYLRNISYPNKFEVWDPRGSVVSGQEQSEECVKRYLSWCKSLSPETRHMGVSGMDLDRC